MFVRAGEAGSNGMSSLGLDAASDQVCSPTLRLQATSQAHINHCDTPAGPHLLYVLPLLPDTALCVANHV